MKTGVGVSVLVGALLLSACQTPPPQPSQTQSVFGPPADVENRSGLAGPKTYLAPLPTAFILMKQSSGSRNDAFCQAWLPTLTPAKALSAQVHIGTAPSGTQAVVKENIVETDWLLSTAQLTGADCNGLEGSYDWGRAQTYINSLTQVAQKLGKRVDFSGPGPFVVVVVPGVFGSGGTVVIDSSPVSDFSQFVQSYQQKILTIASQIGTDAQSSSPDPVASATRTRTTARAVAAAATGGTATGTTTAAGSSTSSTKPWYSGIFGIITGILEAVWPGISPVVTIINAVICG
jgi:hypothetical protein